MPVKCSLSRLGPTKSGKVFFCSLFSFQFLIDWVIRCVQIFFKVDNVTIVLEMDVKSKSVPMLVSEIRMDGEVNNWSHNVSLVRRSVPSIKRKSYLNALTDDANLLARCRHELLQQPPERMGASNRAVGAGRELLQALGMHNWGKFNECFSSSFSPTNGRISTYAWICVVIILEHDVTYSNTFWQSLNTSVA